MRTTLISLMAVAVLAGCGKPEPLTADEIARADSTIAVLTPCKTDMPSCLGWIVEMRNGQLYELSGLHEPGGYVDRRWMLMHTESRRPAARISRVYTPEDPDFRDAVYRRACQYNVSCLRMERGS